jgi:hypothetical protein
MKTLIVTLAILGLSLATLPAKDGSFASAIIPDNGDDFRIGLSSGQWLKITNFTQNDTSLTIHSERAGVAVFKGNDGLWVLFATFPGEFVPHEDLFVGGPATVVVSPQPGATVFLTYQRGSD